MLLQARGLLGLVLAWAIVVRWSAGYALAFLAGFAAIVAFDIAWRRRRIADRPDLHRAVALFDAGLTDDAIVVYERELDRARAAPPMHSAVLVHLSRALARKGRVEEALSMLYAVHDEGWLYSDGEHYGLAASIASVHASLGELEDATRWHKVARGRVQGTRSHPMAVLEAVLDARRERYAELADYLEAEWPELSLELADKAYPLKILRLLRAFALDRARSADGRPPPELGALVAAARAEKGELVQHRAHWKAFDTFLASHDVE